MLIRLIIAAIAVTTFRNWLRQSQHQGSDALAAGSGSSSRQALR
ncbi:hypothetical protein ACFQXB_07615 [Plastorhodobacter daqingensis]|uniref:Uncharacterized protein n=1 Tax=Plastorhodobacter daqingensis TaxID=1387281 RepID=A0ABW2UHA7_9RHOB